MSDTLPSRLQYRHPCPSVLGPGSAPTVSLPSLPGKSCSAECYCPQSSCYHIKPPWIVSMAFQALAHNTPQRFCLKKVFWVHETNSMAFPNPPSLSSKPIWKYSLYFIVTFLFFLMNPQLTFIIFSFLFILPNYFMGTYNPSLQISRQFCFYKSILQKCTYICKMLNIQGCSHVKWSALANNWQSPKWLSIK